MFSSKQKQWLIDKYGVNLRDGWIAFDLDKGDEILVRYVRDTDSVGFSEHKERHDKNLILGEIYRIDKIRLNDCFTLLFLDGVPEGYNSVHFDVVKEVPDVSDIVIA